MSEPVSSIRNLGPATERAFARAGVHTAEEIRAMGPDAAYTLLLAAGERPHFIGYYALVMGLQGRPWNDCRGKEKEDLRVRFDKVSASATSGTAQPGRALATELNRIGVRLDP